MSGPMFLALCLGVAGLAVVAPYLAHRGIESISTLVVSHGDNDHIGGVSSLVDAYRVERLLAGVPAPLSPQPAEKCRPAPT